MYAVCVVRVSESKFFFSSHSSNPIVSLSSTLSSVLPLYLPQGQKKKTTRERTLSPGFIAPSSPAVPNKNVIAFCLPSYCILKQKKKDNKDQVLLDFCNFVHARLFCSDCKHSWRHVMPISSLWNVTMKRQSSACHACLLCFMIQLQVTRLRKIIFVNAHIRTFLPVERFQLFSLS